MRLLWLPPARIALRHPALRTALLLLLAGPLFVSGPGRDADAPMRLRALGLGLVVAAALAWDDRVHALTAATPVGLPAVRRGRLALVAVPITVTFALGCQALPQGVSVPVAALALQLAALTALVLAVVAWFGRDGDPVLALATPAVLVTVLLLPRLPHRVALLVADPSGPGWPAERTRWLVLLVLALGILALLDRDQAARPPRPVPAGVNGRRRSAQPPTPAQRPPASRE